MIVMSLFLFAFFFQPGEKDGRTAAVHRFRKTGDLTGCKAEKGTEHAEYDVILQKLLLGRQNKKYGFLQKEKHQESSDQMQTGKKRLICAVRHQNGKSSCQKKQDHISFDRNRFGKEFKLQIIENQDADGGDYSNRRETGIRQEPGEVFLRRPHQ